MFSLRQCLLLSLLCWGSVCAGFIGNSYIKSQFYGDFLKVENMTLKQALVYDSKPAESMCQCRTMCWMASRCNSASLRETPNQKQCDLSESGPDNSTVHAAGLATSIFWLEPMNLAFLEVLPGYMYWTPLAMKNFSAALEFCASVPRHRLMVIKTEGELQLMQRASAITRAPILLNLKKSQEGPMWGDQTLHSRTPLASLLQAQINDPYRQYYKFVMDVNYPMLVETDAVSQDYFLCQGHLDN